MPPIRQPATAVLRSGSEGPPPVDPGVPSPRLSYPYPPACGVGTSGSHRASRRGNGARHVHHHADRRTPDLHHGDCRSPDHQRAHPGGRAAAGVEARSRLCRRGRACHDRPRGHRAGCFADSTGASIPIAAFAQLTLFFSLVGVGIAAVMARTARRPRATFVRAAVALTTLSVVPGPHVRVRRRLRGHLDHAAHGRRGDRGSDPGEGARPRLLTRLETVPLVSRRLRQSEVRDRRLVVRPHEVTTCRGTGPVGPFGATA
jgi:hypothetical protein